MESYRSPLINHLEKMKIINLVILGMSLFVFSCKEEQPLPIDQKEELIPISYTEEGFTKTLTYNEAGKLTRIHYATTFSDGNILESVHDFRYNADGVLTESENNIGWRLVYTYDGDLIVKTEEYLSGQIPQYHLFTYDDKKRLIERVTYQDILEEGGDVPVSKESYVYDQHDNITIQRLYYYTSYGAEARLLSEFEFSEYDEKINSEEFFDIMGINPFIRLRKNNPGVMTFKNNSGLVSLTERYTYTYHEKGYPIIKAVDVTQYNGTTGSYEARYTFK